MVDRRIRADGKEGLVHSHLNVRCTKLAQNMPLGGHVMNEADQKTAERLADTFRNSVPDVDEIHPLTSGGSAFIFQLKLADSDDQALKILRPDQVDQEELFRGFEEEGQLLCEITHPRIVKGFSCGQCLTFDSRQLPWYTMEYFPHDSLEQVIRRGPQDHPLPRKFSVYIILLRQALEALQYLHSLQPPRCHLDIKEANLLVDMTNPGSPFLKLSDFGVSKEVSRDQQDTYIRGSLNYWPEEWQEKLINKVPSNNNRARIRLPRKEIPTAVDLHMLSVAFMDVLNTLFAAQTDSYWYRSLELLLAKMNWDLEHQSIHQTEKYRHLANGTEASKAMEDLLSLERTPSLPPPLEEKGSLRVPINSLAAFSTGLEMLLDSPWFQRLRRVRQLGVTHLVYPGAVHTRFEHAIGTYAQTLQYIKALFENKNSPWFAIHFSAEEIRTLALVSLCHDIGHYSFAHQLEDLVFEQELPTHEQTSYDILTGEIIKIFPKLESIFGDPAELRTIIEEHWNVDFELFLQMFSYCYREDLHTDPLGNPPRTWRAAAEIVNGPIDADKFDYLRRDSHHVGVSYGFLNDPSRFLSSLTIAFDDVGTHLAVTEKGRVDAEFIAVARYAMFSEVYWHHTVRSFTAMIRRALQSAFSWRDHPLKVEQLLRWSDDLILRQLEEGAAENATDGTKELVHLVSQRQPYARLFTLRKEDSEALYEALTARRNELMKGDHWSEDKELIQDIFGVAEEIEPHHLLWDIPRPGKDRLREVPIADIYGNILERNPGPLWSSLSENFEKWVRKIRLFIHPNFKVPLLSRLEEVTRHRMAREGLSRRFNL